MGLKPLATGTKLPSHLKIWLQRGCLKSWYRSTSPKNRTLWKIFTCRNMGWSKALKIKPIWDWITIFGLSTLSRCTNWSHLSSQCLMKLEPMFPLRLALLKCQPAPNSINSTKALSSWCKQKSPKSQRSRTQSSKALGGKASPCLEIQSLSPKA